MSEQQRAGITQQTYSQLGLSEAEYRQVCADLGREPNETELRMYGVLWSEHCAYKHSRSQLRTLPVTGDLVIQGPGEGAGVIDIGDGLALAFKVESHNHPSFIEPSQGAATGVGGILRDVFSMGARPIAILDSLRFGAIEEARQRHLFGGVVSGIGLYGNCMGIPTVGGEVYFEDSYRGNCLVNAMCAGLVPRDGIRRGIAKGPGNLLFVVGARTGRDGIGGASFASAELHDESEADRPAVQVGDPFLEKLLLEACLELYETDAVIGIQDCGAAGLTSACCEMAAKGGVGIEIDVTRVPRREEGMLPWEVMISESQERMVVCVERGQEDPVVRIFEKWGLQSAVIGTVTDNGLVRITAGGRTVAEVPAASIADGAPAYTPAQREPAFLAALRHYDLDSLPEPANYGATLVQLMGSPNLCSREWIYRQYDHMVLLGTVVAPGGDAALLRLQGTKKGVALSIDCNGRYCFLNPRRGAAIAVAEAARNCVVTGAKPAAITNNLNFGNPTRPEIYWQFAEAVAGIGEACRALGTPVTGGNVSFYNETNGEPIYPTPTIGMVGIHPDVARGITPGLKQAGDVIILAGAVDAAELGGSEYAKVVHGVVAGDAPALDLELEARLQQAVLQAMGDGLVTAAHDVAEGGLLVALTEMLLAAAPGARGLNASLFCPPGRRVSTALFGEGQSRILLSCSRDQAMNLVAILMVHDIPHRVVGEVTASGRLEVGVLAPGTVAPDVFRRQQIIDMPLADVESAWKEALPRWMDSNAQA